MRVIAGSLKGRRLKTPTWDGVRPTSDKLRETLFNILAPRIGGARVLDGYAGTGAVGIEALSRGAAHVTFVERDRRAQALVAENLAHCGMSEGYVIIRASVSRALDDLGAEPVDIISRGARLFDRIIVAILVNAEKAPLFSMDERVEIARAVFRNQANVEVDTFDGLLVDYVERRKAQVIVRGLRAVSDFEFEFQMALMNRRLNATIETVFMMPAEQYTYISSRLIKEVFARGGRVHG